MLKKTLIILGAAFALALVTVLVLAVFKPDTFEVMRSVDVKAPPAKVYPLVADFRRWGQWSPYETMGPMERRYSGAPSGIGARYDWQGDKPGMGSMEIVRAEEPHRIELKLDFVKPIEAHNLVDFTFVPKGELTTVTWDMHGPLPYVFKIFHVIFDMDAMVGKDMETGLAALKVIVEK